MPVPRIKSTEEHELKLAVEPDFELPELAGTELEPRLFTSTYHDAPDLRLARRYHSSPADRERQGALAAEAAAG